MQSTRRRSSISWSLAICSRSTKRPVLIIEDAKRVQVLIGAPARFTRRSLPGFGGRFDHTPAERFELRAQFLANHGQLLDALQDLRKRRLPLNQRRRRRPDELEFP